MKSVLVTGSEGFIGKNLCDFLTDKGYYVERCDKKLGRNVMFLSEEHIFGTDFVVHLAAQTSVWNDDVYEIEEDNIRSFIHIFELCKKLNKRLIFASSSCANNITSMYGLSKKFDEDYFNLYKYQNCVGIRFHNVYGINSREDTLLGKCMSGKPVTLYNKGNNKRHFTYIDDVCECILKAFTIEGGIYNCYNPEELTTLEFCQKVNEHITNIEYKVVDEKRDRDKEEQYIDDKYINLNTDPTSVDDGLIDIYFKIF